MVQRVLIVLLATAFGFGCRTAMPESKLRADSALVADEKGLEHFIEEARKLLLITGKGDGSKASQNRCTEGCHGIDPDKIKTWAQKLTELEQCFEAVDQQITDSEPDATKMRAQAKLNCMKSSSNANGFSRAKLGFARAGLHTESFRNIFIDAYGEQAAGAMYDDFVKKMRMPPDEDPELTVPTEDYLFIKNWSAAAVANNFQGLDEAFELEVGGEATCVENVSDAMLQHVAAMKTEGWGAKNKALNLPMFGCQDSRCFEQVDRKNTPKFPLVSATSFGRSWIPVGSIQTMRHLRTLAGSSSFWMRSSADGRFVANGGAVVEDDQGSSAIEDLLLIDRPRISVSAAYDPGFFPDNKGWTFHGAYPDDRNSRKSEKDKATKDDGGESSGGAVFCSQRILEDPKVKHIDATQHPLCTTSSLSVYQHVGASLDGSGYYVMRSSNYTNDDGAYSETSDPSVISFSSLTSQAEIWPMQATAESFEVASTPIEVTVPYEGDWSISPSALLTASRIAGGGVQQGYRIRRIEGDDGDLQLVELATVCMPGGKATFSFDERFMAVHHYVASDDWRELGFKSPDDERFNQLINASSNIYIYDFVKKQRIRLTQMQPGQFALYPHFRSDNYIYFLVRDTNEGKDHVIATDAAVLR